MGSSCTDCPNLGLHCTFATSIEPLNMEANSLPLHCNVCPNQPYFSDVSHLLTHVASKGHLSNHYKVKVRAGSDPESREILDTYDRWYAEWNVEALISERMHHKDNKKKIRPRAPARRKKNPASAENVNLPIESQTRVKSQNDFDLELEQSLLPLMDVTSQSPDGGSLNQCEARPKMHLWSTLHPGSVHAVPLDTLPVYGSEPRSPQEYPTKTQTARSAEVGSAAMSNIFDESQNDSSKLKGVYWPGMSIFDAASPDMRRKRNQKKDISVVEQLEHNSSKVEPTEMIFTPSGSLKKSRPITGQIDLDSSPLQTHAGLAGCYPLPLRPALGSRDVNSDRLTHGHTLRGHGLPRKNRKCPTRAEPNGPPTKIRRSMTVFKDASADPDSSGLEAGLKFLNAELPSNAYSSNLFSNFGNDSIFQPGSTFHEPYFDEMTPFRESSYTQTNLFASPKDECSMLLNDAENFLSLHGCSAMSQETDVEDTK